MAQHGEDAATYTDQEGSHRCGALSGLGLDCEALEHEAAKCATRSISLFGPATQRPSKLPLCWQQKVAWCLSLEKSMMLLLRMLWVVPKLGKRKTSNYNHNECDTVCNASSLTASAIFSLQLIPPVHTITEACQNHFHPERCYRTLPPALALISSMHTQHSHQRSYMLHAYRG